VKIGQIVKKWQPCFEIQDGGDRHLNFFQICISDVIDMFQIEFPMLFSTNCGDDMSKTKEMAAVFRNPDGGSRHLKKYTSG